MTKRIPKVGEVWKLKGKGELVEEFGVSVFTLGPGFIDTDPFIEESEFKHLNREVKIKSIYGRGFHFKGHGRIFPFDALSHKVSPKSFNPLTIKKPTRRGRPRIAMRHKIMNHIMRYGGITRITAEKKYGCLSLAQRIRELRKHALIYRQTVVRKGKRIARYTLKAC